MSDGESLFAVVVLIYGLECLVWVRLGGVAFRSWTGSRWRLSHPAQIAGNARGGFVLAHPLPPLGVCLCAAQWPVSLSPHGACAYHPGVLNQNRRPPQSGTLVRFAEVKQFRHLGKNLYADRKRWCQAASEAQAAWLVEVLEQLRQLAPDQRSAVIRTLMENSLRDDALQKRRQAWLTELHPLRRQANGLFVSTLLLAPALVWWLGISRCWWLLLALLLPQLGLITWRYYRAHRRLLPGATEERLNWTLTMALALPAAMRAHDLLGRQAFCQFHPAALAKAFCDPQTARTFAAEVLRDWRHPLQFPPAGIDPERADLLRWHHAQWGEVLGAWIRRSGWTEAELLPAPQPTDPAHRAHCPRCLAQYTIRTGACHECGADPLQPFV